MFLFFFFFFSSRRRHTRFKCDWSSDVCSSDLDAFVARFGGPDDIVSELLDDADAPTRDLLVRLATRICELSDEAGEVMRAVACESTRDPELAAAVEEKVHRPKLAAIVELLQRGVDRGEVRPEAVCGVYADVLPAMLTYRVV